MREKMLKLLDLKAEVLVTVAETVFQFRPLMYEERMSLTIATVGSFQREFADIPPTNIKDDAGNDVLVDPHRALMRSELFGQAVDKIMIKTFIQFPKLSSTELSTRGISDFSGVLDAMQDRSQREELRDEFLKEQGVDFENLLRSAGNSESLSNTSPQNQESDKEQKQESDESLTLKGE